MRLSRLVLLALVCAAASASFAAAPAHAKLPWPLEPGGAARPVSFIVALPAPEAEVLIATHGGAFGVGVYPDSRRAADFWREVSAGAPRSREGVASPLAGRMCLLVSRMRAVHPSPGAAFAPIIRTLPGAPPAASEALRAALCDQALAPGTATAPGSPEAIAAPTAASVTRLIEGTPTIVFGIARSTPLVIGVIGSGHGILTGGIARRPAVVTPYDLTATILARSATSIPSAGVIGRALRVRTQPNPLGSVRILAARFERDAGIGPGIAAATIVILLGCGIVLTGILLAAGASTFAQRSARGAAAAVSGYVASLFVPSGSAVVRAIPIVVLYLAAASVPVRTPERTRLEIGRLLGFAAALIGILTIAAALRPGGEPALSLWGDPLESWRFFGLRNHLTSMMQLGVLAVVAAGMGRPSPRAVAAVGVAGAFVAGAAQLGANFVAVFTLVFGAALVALVLRKNRVTLVGVFDAALVAGIAFAVALLADAGSPVSHGGQAVQRVRAGGLRAAYDFVAIRWRLNLAEIGSLWGGWVWATLLLAGLLTIFVWAIREELLPAGARATLAGGCAAALAALFMEDTGFLAGGIIALAPGLIAATAHVEVSMRSRPSLDDGEGEKRPRWRRVRAQ